MQAFVVGGERAGRGNRAGGEVASSRLVGGGGMVMGGGMLPRLSDYGIFQGAAADMRPSAAFVHYELGTTLFSDYAENQRLVKVPAGSRIRVTSDGVTEFPEGTVLAKTFYYHNDKRDPSKGKRIIETRVMVLSGGVWMAGTYLWNAEQTEATLAVRGSTATVQWIDAAGTGRSINYVIPSNNDCATCHNSNKTFSPIGFKARNLNIDVTRDGRRMNQLKYLQGKGLMDVPDPAVLSSLPDWQDSSYTLAQRARAYLDVNCAHCHNPNGYCAKANIDLSYAGIDPGNTGSSPGNAGINPRNTAGGPDARTLAGIVDFMRKKRMPLLGTTIVHREGLALIESYVNSLHKK